MVTAAAHIITSVIGSGVLSLAWAVAQLGWLAGTVCLVIFSLVTLFTSHLLSDCYRNPLTGKRNYSYMDVVNANLGTPLHTIFNFNYSTTLHLWHIYILPFTFFTILIRDQEK